MGPGYYSAPTANRSGGLDKKIIFIIVLVVIALIVGMAMLVFGRGADSGTLYARAVARQQNLIVLTEDGKKNLTSADLRKVNSDAGLFFASDLTILQTLMQQSGVKNVPKNIASAEASAADTERLAESLVVARYDMTYKSVMDQKLDEQKALLREISAETNRSADKKAIDLIRQKLENIQTQLSKL